MGKRRRIANDPTFDLATRDNEILSAILDTLSEREAYVVREYIAGEETAASVASAWGITPRRVRQIADLALRKLRHPSRAQALWVTDSDGHTILGDHVDVRPRSLYRQPHPIHEEKRVLICEHCSRQIVPTGIPRAGGRPRKYCSDACRQAAYRARR